MHKIKLSKDHVYTVEIDGGRTFTPPSVSQILSGLDLIDTRWYTEASRVRGTRVHTICQYYDENDLNVSSVHPSLKGYFDAYVSFLSAHKPKWTHIEHKIFCANLFYCGMLDRYGEMDGEKVLLDIKTGPYNEVQGFQLAAYSLGMNDPTCKRYTLHLASNGKYSLHLHDKNEDFSFWNACVRVFNFKNKE